MGATEKIVQGRTGWSIHMFGGGGNKKRAEQQKYDAGRIVRNPPKLGEYCLVIKPIDNYEVGIPRNVIKEAYFGQVVRFYPHQMEIRKFDKGKAVRGAGSKECIPLVDVRKSEDLLIVSMEIMPDLSLEDTRDIETIEKVIVSYLSLYPQKGMPVEDVFHVNVGDSCLVNEIKEDGKTGDCYIAEVVYKHQNLLLVQEIRHGCKTLNAERNIIRDDITNGRAVIRKLKECPVEGFLRSELHIEVFEEKYSEYLAVD